MSQLFASDSNSLLFVIWSQENRGTQEMSPEKGPRLEGLSPQKQGSRAQVSTPPRVVSAPHGNASPPLSHSLSPDLWGQGLLEVASGVLAGTALSPQRQAEVGLVLWQPTCAPGHHLHCFQGSVQGPGRQACTEGPHHPLTLITLDSNQLKTAKEWRVDGIKLSFL